jgi:hypothetical protein
VGSGTYICSSDRCLQASRIGLCFRADVLRPKSLIYVLALRDQCSRAQGDMSSDQNSGIYSLESSQQACSYWCRRGRTPSRRHHFRGWCPNAGNLSSNQKLSLRWSWHFCRNLQKHKVNLNFRQKSERNHPLVESGIQVTKFLF